MKTLKQSPVWVCWKRDLVHGKVPVNPHTGGNAQPNNSQAWGTYEQASALSSKYDGMGFMFANGICGIDIDNAIGNPAKETRAKEIIDLMDTYTETSPSGKGYHIIFKVDPAKLPTNEIYKAIYYQKNHRIDVECYISGLTSRYFTYTGDTINNLDIEDRTDQLLTFLNKYMQKNDNPPVTLASSGGLSENSMSANANTIISIAKKAKNRKKFIDLFIKGDKSKYNNDDSSADMALCCILAFYCKNDPSLIDQIFRKSALYREKWEREDYRASTISKAIALQVQSKKVYDWTKKEKTKTFQSDTVNTNIDMYPGALKINPFASNEAKKSYPFTDLGMGNLFADVFKNISRYVPETDAWYVYNGRVWKHDIKSLTVSQQAKALTYYMFDCGKFIIDDDKKESWYKFICKFGTKKARDIMLEEAKSVHPLSVSIFDKNKFLFNCQNGTYDLRTHNLREHCADDFLSMISNVSYDPTAKCDRWKQFISEIMCDDKETAIFLQKALGYALTADTSEECLFMLYGSMTRNGKGTTMESILNLMGDYGRTAQPETIGQKLFSNGSAPSEDIARLKGARFVNMSEPDKGLRLNASLLKQVTGGDKVTARFLHQNSFEFYPEFKLFINTNHLPKVNDDSIFASRRVKLIPFLRHFSETEQNKGLKDLFQQPHNISGIFNWLIEGLKLKNAEGLEQPESVTEATNQYREESDTMGLFISDCLKQVYGWKVLIRYIYECYKYWCDENGYSPLNSRNLNAELRKKGLIIRPSTGGKTYLFDYHFNMDTDITFDFQNKPVAHNTQVFDTLVDLEIDLSEFD